MSAWLLARGSGRAHGPWLRDEPLLGTRTMPRSRHRSGAAPAPAGWRGPGRRFSGGCSVRRRERAAELLPDLRGRAAAGFLREARLAVHVGPAPAQPLHPGPAGHLLLRPRLPLPLRQRRVVRRRGRRPSQVGRAAVRRSGASVRLPPAPWQLQGQSRGLHGTWGLLTRWPSPHQLRQRKGRGPQESQIPAPQPQLPPPFPPCTHVSHLPLPSPSPTSDKDPAGVQHAQKPSVTGWSRHRGDPRHQLRRRQAHGRALQTPWHCFVLQLGGLRVLL